MSSDLISYLKAKAAPAAKYIESQLDLVPYLSVLDHTETFEHGVLAIVIGIFPPSGQVRYFSCSSYFIVFSR